MIIKRRLIGFSQYSSFSSQRQSKHYRPRYYDPRSFSRCLEMLLLSAHLLSSARADDSHIALPALTEITIKYNNKTFRALSVNPKQISLHWKNAKGEAYGYFSHVRKALIADKKTPMALINAGIYGKDKRPAGLHIENGEELKPLNTVKGHGNFHLQPNGVFYITMDNKAHIVSTAYYQKVQKELKIKKKNNQSIRLATQSGPMLLLNGNINSKFIANSRSFYSRTGVCTTPKSQLYFISTAYMTSNFYQFAQAAKQLGCDNALYLDGNISKMYVEGDNTTFHFVPLVGILSVNQ